MLRFKISILPSLRLLVDKLLECGVDIYLSGDLGDGVLYVDIDHITAQAISPALPSKWTLIYPYFLSSEARRRGDDDPLINMTTDQLRDLLRVTLDLEDESDDIFQENIEGAMVHIEYLLKRQPSRLVYLRGTTIAEQDIDELINILPVKNKPC